MVEKQKPQPDIVKVAAKAMKEPGKVTPGEVKRMGARILDDQRNDPNPHKPKPKPPAPKALPPKGKGKG